MKKPQVTLWIFRFVATITPVLISWNREYYRAIGLRSRKVPVDIIHLKLAEHKLWEDAEFQNSAEQAARRRAATLAFSTARTGGSPSDVIRVLGRSGIDRVTAHELAAWAASETGRNTRAGRDAKAG